MDNIPLWLVAAFSTKLLLYIAFAMSLGGVSAMLMTQRYEPQSLPFLGYATWGTVLGLLFSSASFLAKVGSFAEAGLAGMWDDIYIDILWQSGVGMSYKLRLIGWFGLLMLLIIVRFKASLAKPILILCFGLSFLIAASFTFNGHTTNQATWVRIALVLHIFIAMWWVGFLHPLRLWCESYPTNTLRLLMHEFGKQASLMVATLLLAGLGISYALESNFDNLFTSAHGNVLILKLSAVAAILAFAALHKFRLVPALNSHHSALALQRSISIEMVIALIILIVTAVLSTLVGPAPI